MCCQLEGRGMDSSFLVSIPATEAGTPEPTISCSDKGKHKSHFPCVLQIRNLRPHITSVPALSSGKTVWVILFPWGLFIASELGVQHWGLGHFTFLSSAALH